MFVNQKSLPLVLSWIIVEFTRLSLQCIIEYLTAMPYIVYIAKHIIMFVETKYKTHYDFHVLFASK